jgi:hypothetical protein
VRAVCASYDLPYTTGPLARQYLLTLRTVCKLALPDRFLSATSDDAPETASEDKFRNVEALHLPRGAMTIRGDADWVARYWTERMGGRRVDQQTLGRLITRAAGWP